MSRAVLAAFAGVLFGLGLGLSGMANPAKVIGFLDVAGGAWDPSLAFVMLGAIVVHAPVVRWIRGRGRSWLEPSLHLPPAAPIDRRLLAGAALFGVGWGVVGYCPGPALLAAAALRLPALLVLAGMLAGMSLVAVLRGRKREG